VRIGVAMRPVPLAIILAAMAGCVGHTQNATGPAGNPALRALPPPIEAPRTLPQPDPSPIYVGPASQAVARASDGDVVSGNDSPFVGRYDGSAMETAHGLRIAGDGTFQWALSVGALDMRAKGTWQSVGDDILFRSDPVPVPARFVLSGRSRDDDPADIKIAWASSGNPFDYAFIIVQCGETVYKRQQVIGGSWNYDPQTCPDLRSIRLIEDIYEIESPLFLWDENAPSDGETLHFAFEKNDLGWIDWTGFTGTLTDGTLSITGGEWPLRLRKLPARDVQSD
jgi:hypothetical protein